MKPLTKIFILSSILTLFVACDLDENYSYVDQRVDIATVENPDSLSTFFFRLDDNKLMWTEFTNFRNYRPKNGQRIIAYYTIISDKRATGLYDYDVRLNDVYPVLTKGIFSITPATQDSIGNDSIKVSDIWIGSDFLNIEFSYQGYDKVHYINLVSDSTKVYTDGKIHLEFRHNSNGDSPYYYENGIVSFKLNSLQKDSTKTSFDLVIHVNIPNQAADKLYTLTYKPGVISTNYRTPKIEFRIKAEQKVY